ncbi:MAG: hypothetical protein IPM63_03875 [Acidobacteriota bacterium]|nr:MAG: hypothetical protein IPM63_03875 [Acidobacteriota bacterium]
MKSKQKGRLVGRPFFIYLIFRLLQGKGDLPLRKPRLLDGNTFQSHITQKTSALSACSAVESSFAQTFGSYGAGCIGCDPLLLTFGADGAFSLVNDHRAMSNEKYLCSSASVLSP